MSVLYSLIPTWEQTVFFAIMGMALAGISGVMMWRLNRRKALPWYKRVRLNSRRTVCTYCGATVPEAARECPTCGTI